METGWRNSFTGGSTYGGGTSAAGDGSEGQNSNFTNNIAWDNVWDTTPHAGSGGTHYDWCNHAASSIPAATARVPETSVLHALLSGSNNSIHRRIPDPHMMCLKLGKRYYCEDAVVPDRHVTVESLSATKRGKLPYQYNYVTDASTTPTTRVWPASPRVRVTSAAVARCQVEGCHVALGNAKEYYKRHKVCEIHSKAPRVVVSGLQQRFCQQCSRFHGVTEFDEAKRSCRRRLEGHNQRRRKGKISNSLPRNFPYSHDNYPMMERQHQPLTDSTPGCALSLLSAPKTEPWISSDDLSSRCSDALYELIAANRATSVVGHFLNQSSYHQSVIENTMPAGNQIWDGYNDAHHTTMTLDLMEARALDVGLLSMKEKAKDTEEWTDYCWSPFGGANVV